MHIKKVRNLDSRIRFGQEEINFKLIAQLEKEFELKLLLSIVQLAKSTYCYWRKIDRPDKHGQIK